MPRAATGQIVERPTRSGTTYALRFRAYGERQYITLGSSAEGWTRQKAEAELTITLAQVTLGTWLPPSIAVRPTVVDPTFHEFATEWFSTKKAEIAANTAAHYFSDLTLHLLPFFAEHRLSEITIPEVDRYRHAKVKEGKLKARTINMHLQLLSQILEVAVDHGHIDRNPAAGKRRRLKAKKPRPVFLDTAEQMRTMLAVLGAADKATTHTSGRRACLAALLFAGLRAHEATNLVWRDVDLANGRLFVPDSKTDAGVREIDLLPVLRDELASLKAAAGPARSGPEDPVFVTRTGKPRDNSNLRQRVVGAAVRMADNLLVEQGSNPLPRGVSPHKLRHSFASLLFALGKDPVYVMEQLGHTDPAFTLRVYAHMKRRSKAEKKRLKALVEGCEWAPMGTSEAETQTSPAERSA